MNTQRLQLLAHFSLRLLAVSTAAWLLASATLRLWENPAVSRPAGLSDAAVTTPSPTPLADVSGIVRRNLFGIPAMPDPGRAAAPEVSAPTAPSAGDIDETTLPVSKRGWELLGTIASTGQGEGRGVLVVNGTQKLYAVGEAVADGWVVEQVRRQCVIVVKNRVRERLLMATPSPAAPPSGAPQAAKPFVMDPATLMRDISLRPATQGSWQGMEVAGLRAGSPLQDTGLRAGDLLLSVNGIRLSGFGDLPNLLPLLANPELTVELVRNGKPVTLRHPAR